MAAAPRRRRIGHRRRVEDEGEGDEGRTGGLDVDDESPTEGSLTDDDDAGEDSDTSNIEETSPNLPTSRKTANGEAKSAAAEAAEGKPSSDTELMLRGMSAGDRPGAAREMHFDDVASSPKSPSGPVVVSSASHPPPPPPPLASQGDRRRQEHEDYKRRRDEDPAFVPNRGAFFMHDHRHAGPAANGFRPFGRGGRGRGAGRGAVGGPFSPFNHFHQQADPTTSSPWTHDMHDVVADPVPRRPRNAPRHSEGPPNGNGVIPRCELSAAPINRTLSTERHIGNAHVRVFMPHLMDGPAVFPRMPIKQYTKLPDHRPPLRSDKPVRISLPSRPPRYVFPATDRSFTFIPRELRPNQQRVRGKPRSALGSVGGGFSRRTSVVGGSYYGSVYSPSVAASRRSSIVHDRDAMLSPSESVMSRPPMPTDAARPVVRLPPAPRPDLPPAADAQEPSSISRLPPPQTHPLPQRPAAHETAAAAAAASIPMHQPRPQKNISVADIEPPTTLQGPRAIQQPFHQQVPVQVANGFAPDGQTHARRPSHPSHPSSGTPLSQIPERAIHAAPFQPNAHGQPPYYMQQVYQPQPPPPPPQAQPQQGYYYPQPFSAAGLTGAAAAASAAPFVPAASHGVGGGFPPHNAPEQPVGQGASGNPAAGPNLVAQEVNGMVYYYDSSQVQPVGGYGPYAAAQGFQANVVGMGGVVTPSPDGFYYPQHAQHAQHSQHASGMVYYSQ
ncbi:hypothetical protein DCS_05377 [Drechmeria coniospora]|uniref:Btz domain-containing protein n=1 Tax=Drechmeria coniospora TaxID=98403 RepID=A0A151GML4_DRECN|nr:hypothetical protein DCS_05377 [Drechmeria coniospora]KYK58364.1 hypothetical protein DCS_05377 [Drechmeria coniospora]